MDDSPIPRCDFVKFAVIVFLLAAVLASLLFGARGYAALEETNGSVLTSLSEFEDTGITFRIGTLEVPMCCCAFFALKKRRKEADIKVVSPPPCPYTKILNC